ncbi:unnamed protein product [Closterium sp. NIES-65]|nr:unnamed protein product [Closterium sp. NIES-65]CAI6011884.1 unnamed protein product [Closterium sp. NIES-65]
MKRQQATISRFFARKPSPAQPTPLPTSPSHTPSPSQPPVAVRVTTPSSLLRPPRASPAAGGGGFGSSRGGGGVNSGLVKEIGSAEAETENGGAAGPRGEDRGWRRTGSGEEPGGSGGGKEGVAEGKAEGKGDELEAEGEGGGVVFKRKRAGGRRAARRLVADGGADEGDGGEEEEMGAPMGEDEWGEGERRRKRGRGEIEGEDEVGAGAGGGTWEDVTEKGRTELAEGERGKTLVAAPAAHAAAAAAAPTATSAAPLSAIRASFLKRLDSHPSERVVSHPSAPHPAPTTTTKEGSDFIPGISLPLPGTKLTPLEEQVVALKRLHPDVLLLVEVGYKFRFFGADADVAARVLGIYCHVDRAFLTASIPTFRLHVHVRRLVEAGFKVGVVRQSETAAIKAHGSNKAGPFGRHLSALYTRATLEAGEDLGGEGGEGGEGGVGEGAGNGGGGGGMGGRLSSYLVCIAEESVGEGGKGKREGGKGDAGGSTAAAASSPGFSPSTTDLDSSQGWETGSAAGMGAGSGAGSRAGSEGDVRIGLVAVETSTGDVAQGCFTDGVLRGELETHLAHFAPTEIVLTGTITPATHKLLSYLACRDPAPRVTTAGGDGITAAAVVGGGPGKAGGGGGRSSSRGSGSSMCGVRAALAEFFATMPNGAACTEDAGKGHEDGNGERKKEREEQQERERQQDEQLQEVDPAVEAVLSMPPVLLRALAAAVDYLREFNLHHVLALGGGFRPLCTGHQMTLSSNALEQLEIMHNSADGSTRGSLLWLLNHTLTAAGGRLMRHWVTHPLTHLPHITLRQEAVAELLSSSPSLSSPLTGVSRTFPGSGRGGGAVGAASRGAGGEGEGGVGEVVRGVLGSLARVGDVERGVTRILHKTATPNEFVRVLSALASAAQQLRSLLPDPPYTTTASTTASTAADTDPDSSNDTPKVKSALLQRLLRAAASPAVVRHARRMLSAVNADAAARGDKVNLIVCAAPSHHSQQQQERKQYDSNHHVRGVLDDKGEEAVEPSLQFPELWTCREAVCEAEGQLNSLLPAIRSQLRLPSLSFFSVSGATHLIEVPSALRVPSDWLKHSAVKAGKAGGVTRYHPPAVLAGLDRLALAKEAAAAAAGRAWQELLEGFRTEGGGHVELRQAVKAFAELDCLCALAAVSASKGYVRPEFFPEDGPQNVLIANGRHPVLDVTMGSEFVPNDTMLMSDGERCHVITGPNMGGKSCYIRQVALICIMAQIGCYVPADSARLHVLDSVLTRMGAANDSLVRRTSTFLEELGEASGILHRATGRSLVIVDELGRGTSTHDGVAIAYATLHVSPSHPSRV